MTMMTSREANQEFARAKREAEDGPVFITDRGRPAHVLMTMENYRRLVREGPTIVEALSHPESAHIDFDPPRMGELSRPVDLVE